MPSPVFPTVHLPHLDEVELPLVQRVRLKQPACEAIHDIEAAVRAEMAKSRRLRGLPRGASVAVAVGSRGIAEIATLTRTVVACLQEIGLDPFIVPAMGSHGGGTAEGQVAVLAKLGVSEGAVGVPVRATMATVDYGRTADGIPCRFDAHAAAADAVVVIARVKPHTSFERPIESGLVKMVAVGLGKQAGAQNVHRLGPRGYTEVLPALARIALDESPLAFGIAVVENGAHRLATIEGVEPEAFFAADERLLRLARRLLGRLPFRAIDALVVERIGKEISGTGMDTGVIARHDVRGIANPDAPFIVKIAVLGLTEATGGNAVGIGIADFVPVTVANGLDLEALYTNSITSTMVEKAKIPVVLPDERACLRALVATCWADDLASLRYGQIRDTLALDEMLASPALIAEAGAAIEPLSEPESLTFDNSGRLLTRI
jgi:hypothetical protein